MKGSPGADAALVKDLKRLFLPQAARSSAFQAALWLLKSVTDAGTVLLNVLDAEHQYTLAAINWRGPSVMEREFSICSATIEQSSVWVVTDLAADAARNESSKAAAALGYRFYAGSVITSINGEHIGALCLLDDSPKTLTEAQEQELSQIALVVSRLLALEQKDLDHSETTLLLQRQSELLQQASLGAPLANLLGQLSHVVELQMPGIKASVMLLTTDRKRLHCVACASLPHAYIASINGLGIGPNAGSSGTAVYRRSAVFVGDIARDPLWADLRELALPIGLKACWSMPILGSEGDVMGAFDFYSAEVRWPTIQDLEVLKIVTSTASVIIERDRHLRRLIDSEEQRREVEQIAQLGYWSASLETFESSISAIAKAICGLPSDQEVVTLQELREMVHPDDLSRVVSEQRTALKAQAPVRSNFRIVHADKSIHHVDMQGNIQFDIDGKAVRYVGTVQDTTEQRLREAALRLYQRAIDSSSNGVVVVNGQSPEMEIIYINRAFEAMTGYALEEVVGRNCRFLQGEAVDQPGRAALRQAIADRTDGSAVLRNFRKDGSEFWVEVRVSPVKDDSGNVTHYVGFQTEISERIRYERELLYQGTHDALTGLPNRALAIEHLDLSLARQRLSGRPAAVIFLDLDRFRLVNDSMGHAIGDQLLRTVAFRLSELRTDRGLVARMGGDEFLLILSECKHYQEIQRFVAEVERTLRLPILFEETQVVPEASIGIAIFPDHGGESSELLRNADIAMSVAKSSGRANHQYFRPELSARAQEQLTLQSELHLALERQEFVLHYQPQFSKHGDFVGLEALIRWNHPARGLLFPGQFIQAAEEFGVIGDIGQWVLVEACRQNRAWQDAGEFFVPVAVNVSAAQFRRSSFFSDVNAALQGARLKPQHLEIEITESMVMESAERFTDALDHLQQIGTKTSLDDFGTGYSSLSFLRTFALDALKIDRMFVRDITTDSSAAVICETIIGMAHSLSMSVVAEGVESIEQANFLRKHDCDVLQGYYFSMPLAPMELVGEMPRLRTCFVEGVRRS